MDPIRVLIVDDHPMVRRGLRGLLTYHGIEVAGEANDSPSALQAAAELAPNIILLDILLPGSGGVELAYQLRKLVPAAKIIILSAFDQDEYVFGALRVGAHAYLLKSTSDETVVEAVRSVHAGKRLLSPTVVDSVIRQFHTLANSHVQQEANLSTDEVDALRLIAQGATNEDIATAMHLSERTVQRILEDIMTKLGARNRAQAVAEGFKRGLI